MQIGRLAPAALIAVVLADALLRFLPIEWLAFRAWEPMILKQRPTTPFEPNRFYHNDRAFGDLANMGNRPDLREFHPETFTTDEFGFRNPPNLATTPPPCAILVGSSFSGGCGVSDNDTLAVQLSQRIGCRVYNAAATSCDLDLIRAVAKRLQMPSGVVLFEVTERNRVPRVPTPGKLEPIQRFWRAFLASPTVGTLSGEWRSLKTSRLKILTERAYRLFQNDRFLPRVTPRHVACRSLRNGEPMLFLADHLTLAQRNRDVERAGAYWSWLAEELKQDHLSLLVFLLPEKYTAYQHLLREAPAPSPTDKSFLGQIEDQLRGRGVPVVNLEPVLRRRAEQDLERGAYLYRRDDSHWNERGIVLAAEAIAEGWRQAALPEGKSPRGNIAP